MAAEVSRICAMIKQRGVAVSRAFAERVLGAGRGGGGGGSIDAQVGAVLNAWLEADVAETEPVPVLHASASSPADAATSRTLERAVVVQIDAALDVSQSAYDQLSKIRLDRDRSAQWEKTRHGAAYTEPVSSKRALKLKLTDGVTAVIGYEVETIPWLKTHTMPGTKIKILAGARIENGRVLLDPRNCEPVWERNVSPADAVAEYERTLIRVLGLDDDLGGDQGMDEDEPAPAPAQGNGTHTGTHGVHGSARGDARTHHRGHGDEDNDDDDDDDDDALMAAMDVEAMMGESAHVRGGRRDRSTHSSSRSATTTQSRVQGPVATVHHHDDDDDDDDFADDYDALLALEREEAAMVASKSATEPSNAPVALKRRRLSVERNKHTPAGEVNGGGHAITTSSGPHSSSVATRRPPVQELDPDTAVTLDVALHRCSTLNSVASLVVGQMVKWTGGLKIEDGAWCLQLELRVGEKIALVALSNAVLTTKLGLSVGDFMKRKKAGKKDPAKKKELTEHFSQIQSTLQGDVIKATRFWLRGGVGGAPEIVRLE